MLEDVGRGKGEGGSGVGRIFNQIKHTTFCSLCIKNVEPSKTNLYSAARPAIITFHIQWEKCCMFIILNKYYAPFKFSCDTKNQGQMHNKNSINFIMNHCIILSPYTTSQPCTMPCIVYIACGIYFSNSF